MKTILNRTEYETFELIRPAKRENNPKRSYLLVNPIQAKHIPAPPRKTYALMEQLGRMLVERYRGERCAVIGFAETATAISGVVAECFDPDTLYLHTTREPVSNMKNLVSFEEEHSHATEQKLYCCDGGGPLREAERIIFVEDEITTGKTILNFIDALRGNGCVSEGTGFAVASLVNSMDGERLDRYRSLGIDLNYLLRIEGDFENLAFDESELPSGKGTPAEEAAVPAVTLLGGRHDPRTGVRAGEYRAASAQFARESAALLAEGGDPSGRILVLGAEEFMYPAVLAALAVSERFPDCEVRVHATTRSPIVPHNNPNYPIRNRAMLESFYEAGRTTYVYNLGPYDRALVVCDGLDSRSRGPEELVRELAAWGCRDVRIARWTRGGEG